MEDERARRSDPPRESGFRPKAGTCLALSFGGRTIALTAKQAFIGRAQDCEICIVNASTSRRHARIVTGSGGAILEDLGSRNGVTLNSIPLTQPTWLRPGDLIGIGGACLEVVEHELTRSDRKHTLRMQASQTRDEEHSTRQTSAFQLLGGVASKALARGEAEEAERILSGHLAIALDQATAGLKLTTATCEQAARFAVRLASATGKAGWRDYAIQLLAAQGQLMPLDLIDDLYGHEFHDERTLDLLGRYVETLEELRSEMGPTERFALKRLRGLAERD